MGAATLQALEKAKLTLADVHFVVAHQANARMIRMIARQLRVPEDKFIVTVDCHANTSAASIPLALDQAVKENKLGKRNIIAMPALGAGLTWGCCVVSW
jgi:3-oxoacyl-[acyl-carrier-protein] synthase-3